MMAAIGQLLPLVTGMMGGSGGSHPAKTTTSSTPPVGTHHSTHITTPSGHVPALDPLVALHPNARGLSGRAPGEFGEARHAAILSHLANAVSQQPLREHTARVARAQIAQTNAAMLPHLRAIRRDQAQRRAQIQATTEHRQILARQQFQQAVGDKLNEILTQLRRPNWRY